ncbi:hypothetical protein BO86DRAFT_446895 [Aspergillus japonicus CBS 114.51]|uniref:Uncharacterized protein n=1 Tax=Aspergillus japonicus CBS 114.51 TaxID=1448312 RepID=A0A8T8X6V5_ASPJA|nr:hypothetical protein BO86DRAFT_446895 [Aspergillus japonicus CBS 114.51]RAH83826.1 hypothetical protein BO86DRAFT_446895 [Aspergillus japonicus CBS 114.51]
MPHPEEKPKGGSKALTESSPLKWQSAGLAGPPTMADVRGTGSAELGKRFAPAKKAAMDGREATVTGAGGGSGGTWSCWTAGSCSAATTRTPPRSRTAFVLAVGARGRPRLPGVAARAHATIASISISRTGGSRLRSWAEARAFLASFGRLSRFQKQWSPELNSAYAECCGIDLDEICGDGRPGLPIVPVYRPRVRIFEINDVQVEHIRKCTWDGGPQTG